MAAEDMAGSLDILPSPVGRDMVDGEKTTVEVKMGWFGPPIESLFLPACTPILDMCANVRTHLTLHNNASLISGWNLVSHDRLRVPDNSMDSIWTLLPLSKMQKEKPTLEVGMAPPTPPRVDRTVHTPPHINVMVSTVGGLGMPPTINIPMEPMASVREFWAQLKDRLPGNLWSNGEFMGNITTVSRRQLVSPYSNETILSLMRRTGTEDAPDAEHMLLRFNIFLPGGKGGFGSQLRAAGGRMSSRKKNRNPEQENASNRNLDGRRLRTITEAKNLAAYLTMKPDMDKKEREEKRKRWEAVVEAAERKEDEIKRGKGNVRLDGQWVEQKEEAEGKTRDAVLAAMKAGIIGNDLIMLERTGSESSAASDEGESDEGAAGEKPSGSSASSSSADEAGPVIGKTNTAVPAARTFFGWDEDDEDMSSEEEDAEEEDDAAPVPYEGKGKGKAH